MFTRSMFALSIFSEVSDRTDPEEMKTERIIVNVAAKNDLTFIIVILNLWFFSFIQEKDSWQRRHKSNFVFRYFRPNYPGSFTLMGLGNSFYLNIKI